MDGGMSPIAFHNAHVATVAAYGEALQELQTKIVFLEAALKQKQEVAVGSTPEAHIITREEREVVEAARAYCAGHGSKERIEVALKAMDEKARPQGRPALRQEESQG